MELLISNCFHRRDAKAAEMFFLKKLTLCVLCAFAVNKYASFKTQILKFHR